MSEILCRWLNNDLRLSKAVDPKTLAKDFSSGYLIGEVLHKYHLQNDFSMFMKKDTSVSKLNNFTRLEPSLCLLGISLDVSTAQGLMQGKQGAATHLLYQLYVSLEKRKREDISGTLMEIMQPAANTGLHRKEHGVYSHVRLCHQKHDDFVSRNQVAGIQVPKPPPYTLLNLKRRQRQKQRKDQQAQKVQNDIARFETNRKKTASHGFTSSSSGRPLRGALPQGDDGRSSEVSAGEAKLILQSNSQYIQEIRQRMHESATVSKQRQKRRERFLAEQLKAREALEESRREEELVRRLTRQTQQEQRLAVQLLQIRMQKDVIRENRLFRERQYQERRERDFREALEREAALARQMKLDRAQEVRRELEFQDRLAAERAQSRHDMRIKYCREIADLIVDLATKFGILLKKKEDISGREEETSQSAATDGLQKIYSHLHHVLKRDAEAKLQKISQHYKDKCPQLKKALGSQPTHQKKQIKFQDETTVEEVKVCDEESKDEADRDQTTVAQVAKKPAFTSLHMKKKLKQKLFKEQQAQMVQIEIDKFETNRNMLLSHGFASSSGRPCPGAFALGGVQGAEGSARKPKIHLQSNKEYIREIRQRLQENAAVSEQRKKRRDRFLVEQLKAHQAQEESRREEELVRRLTRQTQQEQRLAVQLLQIRMQKDVIRENRLFREHQYQERRERDFREALEREAALVLQAKLDLAEEIRMELHFSNLIAHERAWSRYKKHFKYCREILDQIVDLATKVGEYHLLTRNLIPVKQMREWKELLLSGLPLYESSDKEKEILNNQDYDEYTNMKGEWAWPEELGEMGSPPTNNNILGHIVLRLRNIVNPPIVEPPKTTIPPATLKSCVLGKFCSGKSSCLSKIAQAHGIYILSIDTLIEEVVSVYQTEMDALKKYQLTPTDMQSDAAKEEEIPISDNLSTQAKQGEEALKALRKGKAIPSDLLVDIILEAIRQIPPRSAWVLDGFPVDINQAYLLEEALGGCANEKNEDVGKIDLAYDPDAPKPPPPPPPALDLALLLDLPDDCVIRRAVNQTAAENMAAAPAAEDDEEEKDDDDDNDDGDDDDDDANLRRQANNLFLAQIPHRITAFQDTWPKLEEWFLEKQNILACVDANVEEDVLYEKVESILLQVLQRNEEAAIEAANLLESQCDCVACINNQPHSVPAIEAVPDDTNKDPSPVVNDGSPEVTTITTTTTTITTTTTTTTTTTSSPESVSPFPGTPGWVYVDEPLPPDLPKCLCTHWDVLCESYVTNIKAVMQELRVERVLIDRHLYNISEKYKYYLGRPELKQEYVSQWQKYFNSVPEDMREDEETKAELHQRLDDQLEHLWDITEKRKEQNEEKRAAFMGDGWLEDKIAVIINHHSRLMQVELNRFQDTVCILKDYYMSMNKLVLVENCADFLCIPIIDTTEMKDQEESSDPTTTSVSNHRNDDEEGRKSKLCPAPTGAVSQTNGHDLTEIPVASKEKLIGDYEEAIAAITKLVASESHQMDVGLKILKKKPEKEEEKEKEKEKEEVLETATKKGKGKKASKKAKASPEEPSPPPVETSPPIEEKPVEKNPNEEFRHKIRNEYGAAVAHEESGAKMRITMVKGCGMEMVRSLQFRADENFSSMKSWLDTHYLAEMKSIDQLSEVLRHHIEVGIQLQDELVLECTDMYLNGDCHVVATPAPPSRPLPLEKTSQSTLNIVQLESLHKHLCEVVPSGFISSSEFCNLLRDLISVNMGTNTFPDLWLNITDTQVMEMEALLMDNYELIDWRQFLLSAALPWPIPSTRELVAVLQRFKAADSDATGFINKEQYQQVELWFSTKRTLLIPVDPCEPLPYNRPAKLHKFFFQLFADHSLSPPRLDYMSMLQYFAADPDPIQGFIRGLSLMMGQPLRRFSSGHLVKSMPNIEDSAELTSSQLMGECREEESPSSSRGSLWEQRVSIPALLAVIYHRRAKIKDEVPLPPGCMSQMEKRQHLVHLFKELDHGPEDCVPFSALCQHPLSQSLIECSVHHQLVDIHSVILAHPEMGGGEEANNQTVS